MKIKFSVLFVLITSFICLSCSQIEEKTGLLVKMPGSRDVSRTIAESYTVDDIAKCILVVTYSGESKDYTAYVGKTLFIEDIKAGNNLIQVYAYDSNNKCIAYGSKEVNIVADIINEVELDIFTNVFSSILSVTPKIGMKSLEFTNGSEINISQIKESISFEVNYENGYMEELSWDDFIDEDYPGSKYYNVSFVFFNSNDIPVTDNEGKMIPTISYCKVFFNYANNAVGDTPEAVGSSSKSCECSIPRSSNCACFSLYDDEDTVVSIKKYYEKGAIELEQPSRAGFLFGGWYFYSKDGEKRPIIDNKILESDISEYSGEGCCIKGKWYLDIDNYSNINVMLYTTDLYPDGLTLNLNSDFSNADYESLKSAIDIFTVYEPIGIKVNMAECESINDFIDSNTDEYTSFSNKVNLVSFVLPPNLDDLPPKCFIGCSNLRKIVATGSGTLFSGNCFAGLFNCYVDIQPDSQFSHYMNGTYYENLIFNNNENGKKGLNADTIQEEGGSVVIPEGVEIIDESVFENSPLSGITLPGTLEEISENAFKDSRFDSITIPDSVNVIESYAFKNFSGEINLPEYSWTCSKNGSESTYPIDQINEVITELKNGNRIYRN